MKRRKKYYLVLNYKTERLIGVFPRTPEGKKDAVIYKAKLEKEAGERLKIK